MHQIQAEILKGIAIRHKTQSEIGLGGPLEVYLCKIRNTNLDQGLEICLLGGRITKLPRQLIPSPQKQQVQQPLYNLSCCLLIKR